MVEARGEYCGTVQINGGVVVGEASGKYIVGVGVEDLSVYFLVDANDADQALEVLENSKHGALLEKHPWGIIEPAL